MSLQQHLKYVGYIGKYVYLSCNNPTAVYSAESDKYNFRARYARNVIGIVLGGVVPVLLCISGIILLSMWCKYRKKKATNARFQRQKQEKFKYVLMY